MRRCEMHEFPTDYAIILMRCMSKMKPPGLASLRSQDDVAGEAMRWGLWAATVRIEGR